MKDQSASESRRSLSSLAKILRYLLMLPLCVVMLFTSAQRAWAVSPPTITPGTGIFFPGPTVIITSSGGGTIYFTVDNSIPTSNSQIYSTAFTVNATTTVNAIVVQSGTASPVATAYLKVDPTAVPLLPSVSNQPVLMWLRSDVGVTSTSGNVSGWLNLSASGSALNVSQTNASNQPSLALNDWNGYSAIVTGTNTYFNVPSDFYGMYYPQFYFVTKPTSSTNGVLLDVGNGSASSNLTTSSASPSATFTSYFGSTPESVTASSAMTQGQYQALNTCAEQPSGGSLVGNIYTNGLLVGSTSFSNSIAVTERSINHIGTDNSASANFYSGGFLEILVYGAEVNHLDALDMYLLTRYQLLQAVPSPPIISVPTAALVGPTQVAIAAPPDCICRYTTDGSMPDPNCSPLYTGPIQIFYTQTLNAIAVKNGVASAVSSAIYTLDSTEWPAPNPADPTPLQINVQSPTN
jgi:hypothetical protein